ncbi:MAG: hypothetical protein ACRC6G_04755 [Deefgea sp.]
MLKKILNMTHYALYRKTRPAEVNTITQAPPNHSKKKLSARSCADLTFRIQMSIANGQAQAFQQREDDLAPIPPLMRSIIRDLNQLRELAPEEELKYRYMLSQVNAPITPEASRQFALMARNAKSNDSLYNEMIAVE